MKLKIKKATARVKIGFWGEGSVLAETVHTNCTGVETQLEIESDESPQKIAKLARVSEAGCYVIQTLRNPCPIIYQVKLNNHPLDIGEK